MGCAAVLASLQKRTGGDNFTFLVRGSSFDKQQGIDLTYRDMGNGSYSFETMLTEAGDYSVEMELNGTGLQGLHPWALDNPPSIGGAALSLMWSAAA